MAKIAYIGVPAHGHTNPALAVLNELVNRGHIVLAYNAGYFEQKLAPAGVQFRAFPEPLPTEKTISESLKEVINTSALIADISPHLTRFLIEDLANEQPDLVIYDSIAMWGYVAARVHKLKQVCFVTTFVLQGSQNAIGYGTIAKFVLGGLTKVPKLLRWQRAMAKEFGKENTGGITEFADLNIIFTSQEFHPENKSLDERFCFVGPSINTTVRDGNFPFEQLHEGKKVYISLGTVNHLNETFYKAVFAAFADYPAQFILSAGRATDISQLGAIPENFIVRDYVPQLDILQRVDAFITHGGMNSVHEGLLYGVPEIVVPHHFEQLLNAKRVVQTGAGLLPGKPGAYETVTPGQLRTALDTILNDVSYKNNAEKIGATLKAAGGYLRAADTIEACIG